MLLNSVVERRDPVPLQPRPVIGERTVDDTAQTIPLNSDSN